MPQFLLELLSEEIPARMQGQAARDLERLARDKLGDAGLISAGLKAFAGPRRLTLIAEGLPPGQADRTEERKGPRASAPEQALAGFLRSTGLTREQLTERDGVLFAHIHHKGRPTPEILAEIVADIVRTFPWPKSMRSADGKLRWVRPLRRILCTFDGEIVPLEVDGLLAGDLTQGHRFMGSKQPIRARTFEAYAKGLADNFVVLDVEERRARITEAARTLCFARNLELVEDEGLLDEVAGLTEWPVPILGDMDPDFLDLPAEVIRTSMRVHQRYFAVRDPKTGGLAPHFIVAANIQATDGGRTIAAGNARVLTARLKDARFFWDEDKKGDNFERWLKKLEGVTFHARLGTMAERVERIANLARALAPAAGADPELTAKAARLAKADLASGMVGEFPELQGVMGGYYAREAGLEPQVAEAIQVHYRPQGPNDAVPTAPVAMAVALADKLDTLTGFFGIEERPTGSRDPYALRRAALGVIRIVLEARLRLGLRQWANVPGLLDFFADRLKVLLRDQGKRHDLVDAVFALGDDDLVRIVARVEALDAFLKTEDGSNLLAGYKRAANILRAEAKKKPGEAESYAAAVEAGLLSEPAERSLHDAVAAVAPKVATELQAEHFEAAMAALSSLRAPVDAFFDQVLVNAEDPAVRLNRLRLLSEVQRAMGQVADFSLVGG